jgi:hypothetical protein
VQEEEGAPAAGDRTRIMRFTVGEQEDPVALIFTHHRPRIFSALQPHHGLLPSLSSMRRPVRPSAIAPERLAPLRPHVRGVFQIIR